MENTVVRQLGSYCQDLSFNSLPGEVVHQAKRQLLDVIACAFGTFSIPGTTPTKVAHQAARDLGHAPQCTILVSGEKTSVDLAALVNGVMIRYLDFNDAFFGHCFRIHPSDNIATALAVGEMQGASGKELIEAVVLGYEVQQRLANLPIRQAWPSDRFGICTSLSYSTAAVAAKLLKLDAEGIANAIVLGASRGNELRELRRGQIAMDKALSVGQTGASSILAALLAKHGATGTATLLEGDYGFNKAVLGDCDLTSLIDGYDEFLIMKISVKPYPVEYMTVGMIDCALGLRARYDIEPEEIERVRVGLFRAATTKPAWDSAKSAPETRETADHSFGWNISKAITEGSLTVNQVSLAPLEDKRVMGLMEKIEFVVDDELSKVFDANPNRVPVWMEIITPRGTFAQRADHPKGTPANPLTDEEMVRKLRSTAGELLDERQVEQLIEATWALDHADNISKEYIPLLVHASAARTTQ
ncbi:MAG: MmgE/PrpD family protein [Chloroflexota bacterium]